MSLNDKTVFISGGSRGIGLAIALRLAREGANIAIAAKTAEPHAKLPGTIYSAVKEIEEAGGAGLPLICDIRFEDQVEAAVAKTVEKFGGIDICINNASAISLTGTQNTNMKRYDLMQNVNTRGTFLTSKTCIPHLMKSDNPHILTLSPPLDLNPKWFANHVAYTIAKYGMSLCVLGMAAEFKSKGIGVNALWPRTTIATAAIANLLGGERIVQASRTPEIMADAAFCILSKRADEFTGNFCIDDSMLVENGVTEFDKYRVNPSVDLMGDFFVPADSVPPVSLKAVGDAG